MPTNDNRGGVVEDGRSALVGADFATPAVTNLVANAAVEEALVPEATVLHSEPLLFPSSLLSDPLTSSTSTSWVTVVANPDTVTRLGAAATTTATATATAGEALVVGQQARVAFHEQPTVALPPRVQQPTVALPPWATTWYPPPPPPPQHDPNDYDSYIGSCVSRFSVPAPLVPPFPSPRAAVAASALPPLALLPSEAAAAASLAPAQSSPPTSSPSSPAASNAGGGFSCTSSSSAFRGEASLPEAASAILSSYDEDGGGMQGVRRESDGSGCGGNRGSSRGADVRSTLLTRRAAADAVATSLMGRRYDEDGRTVSTESETAATNCERSMSAWETTSAASRHHSIGEGFVGKLTGSELFDPTRFNTVITGMGGIGKTTLAAMVVARPAILSFFSDGIAWVKLGHTKVMDQSLNPRSLSCSYDSYRNTLRSICEQLGLTPPDFESFKSFPEESVRNKKRRIEQLMDNARQDMINLLFGMTALIVLDDLWHPSDARWFSFANTPASALRLLITTRLQLYRGRGGGGRGICSLQESAVRLSELSEREAVRLFVRQIRASARRENDEGRSAGGALMRDEERMLRAVEVVKSCQGHPVAVRLGARMLGMAATDDEVETILSRLQSRPVNSSISISPILDGSETEAQQSEQGASLFEILGRSFSTELHGPVFASVLKLCFATFAFAFARPECGRPYVPLSTIQLLWDGILLDSERALIDHDPVKSCAAQLLELMERLGLVDSLATKRQRPRSEAGTAASSQVRIVSYRIHHNVMLLYARRVLDCEEVFKLSEINHRLLVNKRLSKRDLFPLLGSIAEMKERVGYRNKCTNSSKEQVICQKLSLLLIDNYVQRAKKTQQKWDFDICNDGYAFQHLPRHMLLAGGNKMHRKLLRLLQDEEFIRGRMLSMGYAKGAKSHAMDVRTIINLIAGRKNLTRSLEDDVVHVHEAVHKFLNTEKSQCSGDALEEIGHAHAEIDVLLLRPACLPRQ